MRRIRGIRPLFVGLTLLAVIVTLTGYRMLGGNDTTRLTVYFTQVKGLYVGDDVDLLGVKVGRVTAIDPGPDRVRVRIEVDGRYRFPADVRAALVAPSLVPVRHVALAPAYESGPTIADGATIPLERTRVPVEWDEVKSQLVRLTRALGPQGADKDGALSRFLETSAANLDGNGAQLRDTIKQLGQAMTTLNSSGDDIFAIVRNLDVFVSALESSDDEVRRFNDSLAGAANVLASDRDDLAATLEALDGAFTEVRSFIETNKAELGTSVEGLGRFANLLSRNRQKLADILQVAPGTVSNFYNIYNPKIPGLTGAFALPNLESPAMFICSAVLSLGGTPAQCESALQPIAQYLAFPFPPIGVGSPQTPGGSGVGGQQSATAPSTTQGDLLAGLQKLVAGRR